MRARTEAGAISEAMDIRCPIGLEVEYDIREPGQILMLYFRLFNEEGIGIFSTIDSDPTWRKRPRPVGHYYTSTAWILGNFLAEEMVFVTIAARTLEPMVRHFNARDVIAF